MAKESKESREIKESKEEKRKALDAAILQIEKQYGTGSVMRLGDAGNHMNVATVPTGSAWIWLWGLAACQRAGL